VASRQTAGVFLQGTISVGNLSFQGTQYLQNATKAGLYRKEWPQCHDGFIESGKNPQGDFRWRQRPGYEAQSLRANKIDAIEAKHYLSVIKQESTKNNPTVVMPIAGTWCKAQFRYRQGSGVNTKKHY